MLNVPLPRFFTGWWFVFMLIYKYMERYFQHIKNFSLFKSKNPSMSYGDDFFIDKMKPITKYLEGILGSNLIGIYPFGSMVLDYFDPVSSDYDILIITKNDIELDVANKLKEYLSQDKTSINKIELCIATKNSIYKYNPDDLFWYKSSVCEFSQIKLGKDWIINRFILLKGKFSFVGGPIKEYIKSVYPEDVVKASKELLFENWIKYKNGAEWMSKKKYQSFAILTMARILFTINNHDCVSKKTSAEWCVSNYKETKDIINWAMSHTNDESEGPQDMCCKMINFTIDKVRNM